MSATFVNGNKISNDVIQNIIKNKDPNYTYRLGVVWVDENPASLSFIKKKKAVGEKIGIEFLVFSYPEDITTRKLRLEVANLQKTRNLDGLIVQLPLPKYINTDRILDGIQPEKDVDCLTTKCIGKKYKGLKGIESPIVLAMKRIFKEYKVETKGKRVLIVGAGRLIGKPVASYFMNKKDTVIIADVNEKNLASLVQMADIIVVGVGKRGLIKARDLKEGVVLIDCGFSLNDKGEIIGDIDCDDCQEKASLISPVPNGMGPITSAYLVSNLINIANKSI